MVVELFGTSFVQGPFTSSGFRTFCQRCKHCTSVLPFKHSAVEQKENTIQPHKMFSRQILLIDTTV